MLLQVEVFDILFVLEQDKKFIVHCQDCARKIHPRLEGFVILKQYHTSQLCEIFDRFQLAHHVSTQSMDVIGYTITCNIGINIGHRIYVFMME